MYSGTPLIQPPMGQKHLAVLTGDRISEVFFYKKMYGRFAERPKKSGRNNEVVVRRGSTVIPSFFRCTLILCAANLSVEEQMLLVKGLWGTKVK